MSNYTLALLLAAAAWTGACSGSSNQSNSNENEAQLSGTIKIDGSSTVYPVSEAVAEDFRDVQPDVRVTIGASGTGAGFKKFARGETDISDASRAIKDSEKQTLVDKGIEYLELTIAYDGLAIVVNRENDWLNTITVDQLRKIWEPESQGNVTRWNQVNPSWPDAEMHLFGPSTAHGTYDYFTEEIMGESGHSRGDFTACADYNVLVQGVGSDINALGYVGLAYYLENQDKLKLVAVDNGNGPVVPNDETVSNGTYSPLARSLYLYVKKSAAQRTEVAVFVTYYLEHAAELATEVGYIALPEEEYTRQLEAFRAFAGINQ